MEGKSCAWLGHLWRYQSVCVCIAFCAQGTGISMVVSLVERILCAENYPGAGMW